MNKKIIFLVMFLTIFVAGCQKPIESIVVKKIEPILEMEYERTEKECDDEECWNEDYWYYYPTAYAVSVKHSYEKEKTKYKTYFVSKMYYDKINENDSFEFDKKTMSTKRYFTKEVSY